MESASTTSPPSAFQERVGAEAHVSRVNISNFTKDYRFNDAGNCGLLLYLSFCQGTALGTNCGTIVGSGHASGAAFGTVEGSGFTLPLLSLRVAASVDQQAKPVPVNILKSTLKSSGFFRGEGECVGVNVYHPLEGY